ncbi:hypothetical protein VTI74DRAFT_3592 [Chaetomium olivicolor]
MQQPLIDRRDDRDAYDYVFQATEDRHEQETAEDVGPRRKSPMWRPGSTPNYKPTPLRWPFICTVIALLLVAIALVIVAEKRMPNSDTSVTILGIHPNATQPIHFGRAVFTNSSVSTPGGTTAEPPALSTTPVVVKSETTTVSPTVENKPSSLPSSEEGSVFIKIAPATNSQSPPIPPVTTSLAIQSTAMTISPLRAVSSTAVSASKVETTSLSISSSHTVENTVFDGKYAAADTSSSTPPVTPSSTASLPSGAQVVPISVSVSKFTTSVTVPVSTVTVTTVFTSVETTVFSSDVTFTTTFESTVVNTAPTTFYSHFTSNGTQGSTPVATVTFTRTGASTIVSTGTTATFGVSTRTTVGTVTSVSTITGVVIPSVGEVTITYYSTIMPTAGLPVTQPPDPVKVTNVEVIDGTTVVVVQTQPPVVVVVSSDDIQTQVVNQRVSTGVVEIGGSAVTNVVVITPSAVVPGVVVTNVGATPVTVVNSPDPVTVVTVIDGAQRTIVQTPPPRTDVRMEGGADTTIFAGQAFTQTVINNVGGTPVTRVVVITPTGPPYQPVSYTVVTDIGGTLTTEVIVTTPTGGQPITYTAVDIVGGTPVTQVVVTTLDAAGFQPVSFTVTTMVGGTPTVVTVTPTSTTIVETINGTPVTRVTTPQVTSFTTTVGGTLTTKTIVTTPTGTEPVTWTLVSTSAGRLSTFTTTIPPTTFLTTVSGSLRTITSTPSPSTSFATRPRTTRTFTTTSAPTASSTSFPGPLPTVISSTRVYRWTEADIFLGTFLPPLLCVALVIPLRIIDLNAKLYQPFQTLARPGGASGSETLLLQYTGLMAFVTPAITLFQGRPVPFLTTLMVACASFMVPLATEAIGLKLHGECYMNTASPTCGPALGVSPGPAHALVGLMAGVVVMLGLVLILLGRWVTGVRANPWNIAGIASLAGSEAVRIQQNGEGSMRKAVKEKQYGLGYFQNEAGREQYGILLMDEAGRGLREDRRGQDTDSELLDEPAAVAKWGSRFSQQLPFMALRYPWRICFILFQLAVLIFIIYYHAYYRGAIRDNGRLWLFMNANTFGVRFVSAIVGVIIAFCWQSFFLSVSTMTPYLLLSQRTQPPTNSILFTLSTNPFSGLYASLRQHHNPFLFCVSVAAILSEFLPVILSNVPFNLAQTGTAATVCAVLSCLFLGFMLAVLIGSFWVRYPPMPVDPRCVAGLMWYVSKSSMLDDFAGVSELDGKEREQRVKEMGKRYFYGVLLGEGESTRLGVDSDAGGGEDGMEYRGAGGQG